MESVPVTAAGLLAAAALALALLARELANTLSPRPAWRGPRLLGRATLLLAGVFLVLTAVRLADYL
jgi:hypothetical protein